MGKEVRAEKGFLLERDYMTTHMREKEEAMEIIQEN